MARQQRRDERQQRAQVGREVDVHVADDLRVGWPTRRRAARGRGPCARAAAPRRRRARGRAASAIAGVASVLALSAMTIRQLNGNSASRKRCRRRMLLLEPGLPRCRRARRCRSGGAVGWGSRRRTRSSSCARSCSASVGDRTSERRWEQAESSLRGGRRTTNARAAAGRVAGRDLAAVGVDDRRDDREARGRRRRVPRSRPPSARQKRSNSACGSSVGRPGPWSRTLEARARRPRARRRPRSACPPACGRARCAGGWRAPGAAGGRRRATCGRPSLWTSISRSGAVARASSTASRASAARSTSACGTSGTSSRRASVSRSSTSTPMRAASSSMRRIACSTSAGSRAAPMRNSSA